MRLTFPFLAGQDAASCSEPIRVDTLDWGDPTTYLYPPTTHVHGDNMSRERNSAQGWDVILGADIVWLEDLVPLLVHALEEISTSTTTILLALQVFF